MYITVVVCKQLSLRNFFYNLFSRLILLTLLNSRHLCDSGFLRKQAILLLCKAFFFSKIVCVARFMKILLDTSIVVSFL